MLDLRGIYCDPDAWGIRASILGNLGADLRTCMSDSRRATADSESVRDDGDGDDKEEEHVMEPLSNDPFEDCGRMELANRSQSVDAALHDLERMRMSVGDGPLRSRCGLSLKTLVAGGSSETCNVRATRMSVMSHSPWVTTGECNIQSVCIV